MPAVCGITGCGCERFEPNTFNPKLCTNCLHKHDKPVTSSHFVFSPKPLPRAPMDAPSQRSASYRRPRPAPMPPTPSPQRPSSPPHEGAPPTAAELRALAERELGGGRATTPHPPPVQTNLRPITPPSPVESPAARKKQGSKLADLARFAKKVVRREEEEPAPMNVQGPTDFKHEGHMGFSEKGIEAFNLPPDWQTLLNNLNSTLRSMGVDEMTKEEAQLLLTGKIGVTRDASGGWNSAADSAPASPAEGEHRGARAHVADAFAARRPHRRTRGARRAGFTIGNRELTPPSSIAHSSPDDGLTSPRFVPPAHDAPMPPPDTDDLHHQLALLREQKHEQAALIVRLETQAQSSHTEWTRKFAALQDELDAARSQMRTKTQDLTRLKIDSHEQANLLAEAEKRLARVQAERDQLRATLGRAPSSTGESEGQVRAQEALRQAQEQWEQERAQMEQQMARLQEQRTQEQQRTRHEQQRRQQVDEELDALQETLQAQQAQHHEEQERLRQQWTAQVAQLHTDHEARTATLQHDLEQARQATLQALTQHHDAHTQLDDLQRTLQERERRIDQLVRESDALRSQSGHATADLTSQLHTLTQERDKARLDLTDAMEEAAALHKQLRQADKAREHTQRQLDTESHARERAHKEIDRLTALRDEEAQRHKARAEAAQETKRQMEAAQAELESALREAQAKLLTASQTDQDRSEQVHEFEQQVGEMNERYARDLALVKGQLHAMELARDEQSELAHQAHKELRHVQAQWEEAQASHLHATTQATQELQASEQERQRGESLLQESQLALTTAQQEQQQLQQQLHALQSTLADKEQQAHHAQQQRDALQAQQEQAHEALAHAKQKWEAQHDALKSQLAEREAQLTALSQDKLALDAQLTALRLQEDTAHQQRADLSAAHAQLEAELAKVKQSRKDKMAEWQAQREELDARIEQLTAHAHESTKTADHAQRALKARLAELESQLGAQGASSQALAHTQEELADLREKLHTERAQRFELEEARSDLSQELERVQGQLGQLEGDMRRLHATNTDLEVLTRQQKDQLDALQSESAALRASASASRASVMPSAPPLALSPGTPPPPPSAPPPPSSVESAGTGGGSRGGLFEEIRGGKNLKKVEEKDKEDPEDLSKHYDDQNVLHVLARALIARRKGVDGDKNSAPSLTPDDDDWDLDDDSDY